MKTQKTELRMLRPAQIEQSYGISRPKLYQLFGTGLPSISLKGRQGRKGTRLVRVADLEKYLDAHTVGGIMNDFTLHHRPDLNRVIIMGGFEKEKFPGLCALCDNKEARENIEHLLLLNLKALESLEPCHDHERRQATG